MIFFTFLHGSAYFSSKNYLFSSFCTLFTVQKWRKIIVEENSENDEKDNHENDEENYENYDYITDRSFEASRLL